jgi:hypothetical protein
VLGTNRRRRFLLLEAIAFLLGFIIALLLT